MMGCLKSDRGQLFYEFHLGDAVPEDHLVRKIDAALDLSWLRSELAPHHSSMGRPSLDPELMIRMLVVGYVFAIHSYLGGLLRACCERPRDGRTAQCTKKFRRLIFAPTAQEIGIVPAKMSVPRGGKTDFATAT